MSPKIKGIILAKVDKACEKIRKGKMKNVLVTGADGFIGSHLCESLVKKGFPVL